VTNRGRADEEIFGKSLAVIDCPHTMGRISIFIALVAVAGNVSYYLW